MRHLHTIHKLLEVAFLLMKVLGGSWSAIVPMVLGILELYATWRGPQPSVASAV